MPEGSVVEYGEDYVDDESEELNEDENIDNQADDTEDGQDSNLENSDSEDNSSTQEENIEKTDKGTRLDSDPLSRANQLRANAEAEVRNYREFLNNPQAVKAYLAELEKEQGGAVEEQEDEITPDQIETTEDLQKFARQLERKSNQKIEEVKRSLNGVQQKQALTATADQIDRQIQTIEGKYSALREFNADGSKNPDFDPELEKELGDLFIDLDYDPRGKQFKGKIDYVKVADRFMKAVKRGESQGSRKAQTIVKDKRDARPQSSGRVSTDSQLDESKMSASETIAARIAKAYGK